MNNKKSRLLIVSALTLLLAVFVTRAFASPVYTVTIGGDSYAVDPLERDMSAADYYNYDIVAGVGSGNPAFGTRGQSAVFWLYEDTTTSEISLGMIFNTKGETALPSARFGRVTMTTSGFPDTAYIALADDAFQGDASTLINGTDTWGWSSAYTTDGAVIGGLNGEWVIDIFTHNVADTMTYWYFLDGPDYRNPEWNLLAISPAGVSFQIQATESVVPLPAAAWLFISGLGVLGYTGWRSKPAREISS